MSETGIVFIVDDMIDKVGSWIAAPETADKRRGAEKFYTTGPHVVRLGDKRIGPGAQHPGVF